MTKQNPINRALSNYQTYQNCSGTTLKQAFEQLDKYKKMERVLQKVQDWFGLLLDDKTNIYTCPFCDQWSFVTSDLVHIQDCPFEDFTGVLDDLSANTNES